MQAVQKVEKLMREGTLLDLLITNKKALVGDGKVRGILCCSAHNVMEFRILREGNRAKSRITALDFRTADFGLYRDLLGRMPWDTVVERREAWRDD